ncbi:MAG: FtsQ-type POTRA domain-containing protein [Acidimicrobiia bacterium]|nr:FtsQ-type POTRA domain-containing protein [Acidimicrobiia bacterium]
MTDGIDPRLARRRRQVQEASARRRLRWMIALLVLAITVGLVVAVFQSSWFSIDSIVVEGDVRAPVMTLLEEAGIEKGVSVVSVRVNRAEEELIRDPWVAAAEVRVVWPRSVEVTVVEHVPIARVRIDEAVTGEAGWVVASPQGVVLAVGEQLVDPLVELPTGVTTPGEVIADPLSLGALEFVAALPIELKPGLVVRPIEGGLEATVQGFVVELGTARDMAQKAVTLAALLDRGVAEGARINLVSPLRPGVTNPQPLVETSAEVATETTVSS